MLDIRRNDNVTGFEAYRVGEKIETFRTVANKNDFVLGGRVEESLNLPPYIVDFFRGLGAKEVIGSSVAPREIMVIVDYGIRHLPRFKRHTGIIEIDDGLVVVKFLQWGKIHSQFIDVDGHFGTFLL